MHTSEILNFDHSVITYDLLVFIFTVICIQINWLQTGARWCFWCFSRPSSTHFAFFHFPIFLNIYSSDVFFWYTKEFHQNLAWMWKGTFTVSSFYKGIADHNLTNGLDKPITFACFITTNITKLFEFPDYKNW